MVSKAKKWISVWLLRKQWSWLPQKGFMTAEKLPYKSQIQYYEWYTWDDSILCSDYSSKWNICLVAMDKRLLSYHKQRDMATDIFSGCSGLTESYLWLHLLYSVPLSASQSC